MNGLSGMPITMLNGMGCPSCMGTCQSLGAVTDYDQITVGGKTYTVNQIIDKTVVASKKVNLYSNSSGSGKIVGTVNAGQPIGVVWSYIKPSGTSDGRSWLMFESGYNQYFFVPNEAVSGTGLKEQGTLTVTEEVKKEQEQKDRADDPIGYYIKKFGLPALLIGGAIFILSGVAKEGVKAVVEKKVKPST